jgi:hypothetical protein
MLCGCEPFCGVLCFALLPDVQQPINYVVALDTLCCWLLPPRLLLLLLPGKKSKEEQEKAAVEEEALRKITGAPWIGRQR